MKNVIKSRSSQIFRKIPKLLNWQVYVTSNLNPKGLKYWSLLDLKFLIWQFSTGGKKIVIWMNAIHCDCNVKILIQSYFLRGYSQNISFYYTLFVISNNCISNSELKLAKNWAKAKQHPEAERLHFENYLLSSFMLSSKTKYDILRNV